MATTYDKASLVMIPSGYKDDKLYSVKPTDGSGDFTFSRDGSGASPATRVNASGLIEKGRTNELLQSNDFSNAAWSNSGGPVLTSGQADPFGGSNAWKFESSSAISTQIFQSQNFILGSMYAKAGNISTFSLWANLNVTFDLSSGTITSGASNGSIEDVGDGWYRLSIFNPSGANVFNPNFTATASGEFVYIAFSQAEYSLVATDYIETTTTAVSAGLLGDMPRLDYSGGATCPSLLLEPSRVNQVAYSEYFNGGIWIQTGSSVTDNDAISPEGVQNAAKVIGDGSQPYIRLYDNLTFPSTGNWTLSVFAKAGNNDFLRIQFGGVDGAQNAYFDLVNGTTPQTDIASIEPVGNDGWYRCSITADLTGPDLTGNYNFFVSYSDTTSTFPSAGDANGQYVYLYGAQLEAGSYPTSYIPCYGSASTRGDDYQTSTTNYKTQGILGSTWTFLYDQTFVDVAREAASSLFLLDNGIGGDGLTNVRISLNSNGSFRLQDSDGTQLSTSGNKILCRYNGSTIAWFVDGSLLDSHNVTDTDFANLDQYNPSQNNKKKVVFNQLLIFPTALTDAECIALTTI